MEGWCTELHAYCSDLGGGGAGGAGGRGHQLGLQLPGGGRGGVRAEAGGRGLAPPLHPPPPAPPPHLEVLVDEGVEDGGGAGGGHAQDVADPEYGHQGLGLRLCNKCNALCSHLLCIVCISHQLDAAELDEEGEDVDGGPGHEEDHGEQCQ